jgi:hypothetical protein
MKFLGALYNVPKIRRSSYLTLGVVAIHCGLHYNSEISLFFLPKRILNALLMPYHSSGSLSPAAHHGDPGWFDPKPIYVRFVVDKVALGQISSEYFGFPCPFSFHQMLHTHYHPGLVQ